MGRGKSSAAIRYMNKCKGEKCFLYISPYLSETERICELCDFDEPGCDYMSKSEQLKGLMHQRRNIASTHSLFGIMDEEALKIASEQGYNLIVDESLDIMQVVKVSPKDMKMMTEHLMTVSDEDGLISWTDEKYEGRFSGYKKMAAEGTLYFRAGTMYSIMNPAKLMAFDEVYMLTYLFDGQLQRAYLDYFGFTYTKIGVEKDKRGYFFSDKPDEPPPLDYTGLIHILATDDKERDRMNGVGLERTALSANWFKQRWKSHADVCRLRKNLHRFFTIKTKSSAEERLWTTFKETEDWLLGDRNRYASNFLSLNARATNAYKSANCVAYIVNRFVNPNLTKFFATRGIAINSEDFALSEMLQFIWRSAIREDKEINLYIPSSRMRELLVGWIEETKKGNYQCEQEQTKK